MRGVFGTLINFLFIFPIEGPREALILFTEQKKEEAEQIEQEHPSYLHN